MTPIDWPAFAVLGAGHGVNPGMGWLFAVALAMQERRGSRIWLALGPLALGHALAVGAALVLAALIGSAVAPDLWRWLVAAALVGMGALRIVRPRHPRFGGMRVGFRDLTLWSLLMATAHGAGLMLVPFANGAAPGRDHAGHGLHAAGAVPGGAPTLDALVAAGIHTLSYLLVTGAIALVVYHRAGVLFLRRAWINLDLVWALALIVTGVAAAFG